MYLYLFQLESAALIMFCKTRQTHTAEYHQPRYPARHDGSAIAIFEENSQKSANAAATAVAPYYS